MSLKENILELLRARDIEPTRRTRTAVADLLALVASENPDVPPLDEDDDGDGLDDDDDDDAGLAVRTIDCPHCGEPMVVELELDGGDQEAIHDCSVCCRPVRFTWQVSGGQLAGFASGPG
jgi:hypothetical protein